MDETNSEKNVVEQSNTIEALATKAIEQVIDETQKEHTEKKGSKKTSKSKASKPTAPKKIPISNEGAKELMVAEELSEMEKSKTEPQSTVDEESEDSVEANDDNIRVEDSAESLDKLDLDINELTEDKLLRKLAQVATDSALNRKAMRLELIKKRDTMAQKEDSESSKRSGAKRKTLETPVHVSKYETRSRTKITTPEKGKKTKVGKVEREPTRKSERLKVKNEPSSKKLKTESGVREKHVKSTAKVLTTQQALLQYRAKLMLMQPAEFQCLHNSWISVEDPNLKDKESYEGLFLDPAMITLRDIAEKKGVHIYGCLPHYGKYIYSKKPSKGRPPSKKYRLKEYSVKREIVDRGREQEYIAAGIENAQGDRICLETRYLPDGTESPFYKFAFTRESYKMDILWQAIEGCCSRKSNQEVEPSTLLQPIEKVETQPIETGA